MAVIRQPHVFQPWPVPRQSARRPLDGKFVIVTQHAEIRGWCTDVGEGGLAGVSSAKLAIGEDVQLRLSIPHFANDLLLRATVRSMKGFRYGFAFLDLTEEQRTIIKEYCTRRTE